MALPNNAPAHRRPSSRGKSQISQDLRRRQQALLDLYNSCAPPQPAEDAERAHRTLKTRSTLRPISRHSQSGSELSSSWSARVTTSARSAKHGSLSERALHRRHAPRTPRPRSPQPAAPPAVLGALARRRGARFGHRARVPAGPGGTRSVEQLAVARLERFLAVRLGCGCAASSSQSACETEKGRRRSAFGIAAGRWSGATSFACGAMCPPLIRKCAVAAMRCPAARRPPRVGV